MGDRTYVDPDHLERMGGAWLAAGQLPRRPRYAGAASPHGHHRLGREGVHRTVHDSCYDLNMEGADLSAQKDYMTLDYLDIRWRRLDLQRRVLKKGYNFIATVSSNAKLISLS